MLGSRTRCVAALFGLVLAAAFGSAFASGDADAAPVLRSVSTGATSSSVRSFTLARPAGVAAGDLLLAAIDARLASASYLHPPSGWRLVRADTNVGYTSELTQALYVRVAGSLEPASYTCALGGSSL